jgi:hypothetical protein
MTGHDVSELDAPPTEATRAFSWLLRAVVGKFGYLLIALLALILCAPLLARGRGWGLLLVLVAATLMLAGLYAARPRRSSLKVGLALAVADFGIGQLAYLEGLRLFVALQALLWLSTLAYVSIAILHTIFAKDEVDAETLKAALCVYLLLGLLWLYLYVLIALGAPDAFRHQGEAMVRWTDEPSRRAEFLRLLVFSYSTLAGTGFGDVVPATSFASLFANLETMIGQVYLAVVIARLVGAQVGPAAPPAPARRREDTP